jgi:hypothetical protein
MQRFHAMKNNENGNVLVYVLIAVGLMAAITFAVSRDGGGQQAARMDDTRADLLATELISHVASAEQVIYHMTQWGTDYSDLKFDLPGTADYNTDVTNQVYHPQGGGLQVMKNMEKYSMPPWDVGSWQDWTFKNTTNVEWTPTTATDVIYSMGGLSEQICKSINKKLLGTHDVVFAGPISYQASFLGGHASNQDLTATSCPNCVDIKSACIERPSVTPVFRLFYTIIGSR